MDELIAEFAKERRFALIGVSRQKTKFGNAVLKTLRQRGLEVYPVHRSLTEIEGNRCYPRLADIPQELDSLVICTNAADATPLVQEAGEKGIKRIWFQQGQDFSEAIAAAEAAGIAHVSGKCILMYAGQVTGIHAVHRFFARLFGKY